MDSYLAEGYLSESKYSDFNLNSKSASSFLVPNLEQLFYLKIYSVIRNTLHIEFTELILVYLSSFFTMTCRKYDASSAVLLHPQS